MYTSLTTVTRPPEGSTLRTQLELKLKEYKKRCEGVGLIWEKNLKAGEDFRHHHLYKDCVYKVDVFERFLTQQEETLNLHDLAREAPATYGDDYNRAKFHNALDCLAYYLGDRSIEMVQVGTGLPEVV